MVLSIAIIAVETAAHERTLIHRTVDYLLYVIWTNSVNRIFGWRECFCQKKRCAIHDGS